MRTLLKFIGITFFLLISSKNETKACHIMGGDITYRMIDTVNGVYEFTLTRYRDCSCINFQTNQLNIVTSQVNVLVPMTLIASETTEVTPLCLPPDVVSKKITNCPGPNVPPLSPDFIKGVMKEVLKCTFTVGRNIGQAFAGYQECCRNNVTTIVGGASNSFYIQTAFNTNFVNNSVIFTNNPVPYWCKGKVNTYAHGPADTFDPKYVTVNGQTVVRDSFSFARYTPWVAANTNLNEAFKGNNLPVTFVSQLNASNFLFTTNGVTMDPFTGVISAQPDRDQDAIMAVAIFEWRAVPNDNGIGYQRVYLGYVCRDLQFSVRDNCDPVTDAGSIKDSMYGVNQLSSYFLEICGRQPGKIQFKAIGAVNQNMKLSEVGSNITSAKDLVNYKFTTQKVIKAGVDTMYGTVTFDSAIGSGDERLIFNFYYCNNYGMKVSREIAVRIKYTNSMILDKDTGYYCPGGKAVRITSKTAKKVSWFPKTGIVDAGPDSVWIDVKPTANITYRAKAIDLLEISACTIYDSTYIRVIPPFTYNLSPKTKDICLHDTFPIVLTTQISDTPYKFTWLNSNGALFDPSSKKTTTSISSPTVYAINSASYIVEMENRYGCILTDTVKVNITGVKPNATATAQRSFICPGDTTLLSAIITPFTCGLTMYKSNAQLTTASITTGSINYPIASCAGATCYPNIYGTTGLGNSSSTRILYTKTQLSGAGAKAGILKSIAFNLINANVTSIESFIIKIGATTGTTANASVPMFTVFNSKAISPALGWNTYSFDRGYDWDGNSNLIVEICVKKNTATSFINRYLTNTAPAGNEVWYRLSNTVGLDACDMTSNYIAAGGTQAKPHTRFTVTGVDSSDNQFSSIWTPSNLINTVLPTPSKPRVIINANQNDSLFTVTYGSTMCSDTGVVKVKADPNFKVKASGGKVICRQGTGGSPIPLTATITSSQPHTITWTSSPNDPSMSATNTANITVNPSTPGTYRYVVKISALPCEATDTVYVTVQDSLKFSLTNVQPTCAGNNGSITAVLPSGSKASDFNYVWTPNVSDSTKAVNLGANTYKLVVQLKADATCKGSQTLNLPATIIPLNITTTASAILCNGGTSDSIVASVNTPASPGPYNYSWSSNPTADITYKITNKVAGTYTVTVTDQLTGCTGTKSITISEPTALGLTFTKTDVNCKGDATGYTKAFPTGGTPNNGFYTYSWKSETGANGTNMPSFQDQFNLFADSLTVTMTDKNGCTITKGVKVSEPSDSLKVALTGVNATVVGGTDGKVFADVTGGTSNYIYKWDSSSFNNPTTWVNIKNSSNLGNKDSVVNKAKSSICVEVIDSKGCKVKECTKVKDIECDIVAQFNKVDVICFGDSTGILNFGAIDNKNSTTTALYTYELYENSPKKLIKTLTSALPTPPAGLQSFTNLKAGVYDIKVKTNKGCDTDFIKLVTINQNTKMDISITTTDPSCIGYNDGKVKVVVLDTFVPFEYSWNGGAYIKDKDTNINLTKGTYIDTVKNRLGCKLPFTYQLKDPAGITIAHTLKKGISCNGLTDGQVEINVTPPISISGKLYEYHSKPGTNQDSSSNILDSLNVGSKTVNVHYFTTATSSACILPYTFTMTEPTKLVLKGSKTDVTCSYNKDGKITLNANNTGTSNYTYEVVRISNGSSVSQSNVPSNTFTGLDSGIYNAFVTDKNGCKESLTGTSALSIGKPSPLKPKISITPASCITSNNGSLKIDTLNAGSNGGYKAITTLTPNFTNPQTGLTPNSLKGLESYRVIVSDKLGCTDTQTVFVDTLYELRIMAALKMDSVSCFGGIDGKLTFNTSSLVPNNGGLTYQWDDANTATSNILTTSAGTYNLTVTDGNKCSATTLGTIEEPAQIVIVGKMKEVSCYKGEDGTVKIAVAGGRPPYQYAWSPLNQNTDSAIGLKVGINTVTVTDSKNCQNTQSFDMPQPEPFIAHIDTVKHITCFGANDGKIVLRIEGGKPQFTYTWNLDTRNASSIDNLIPNISYKVTVTDILGCIAKAETEVKEPFKVELESLKVDSLTCPKSNDGRISILVKGGTITAINQYDYSIDGGNTYEKTNVFEKLPVGEYTVVAKDNNGCMVSKKVTVLAPEELFVSAKVNGLDTIEMGNTTELYYDKRTLSNNLPIINSQLWTQNESLSCANCARTQAMPYITELYNLEVYYHKNCKATSKVKVVVKEPLDFYVPNAFSPGNQDGVNDVLKLYGNSIKSIKFAVFNRWGEKVFETETQEKSWDGNYKGEPAPSGTYTYVAEVQYLNNLVKNKKGSVTLIR